MTDNMTVSGDEIKNLGCILGIWAHPDDESWCMGGIMNCAAANGQRVVCVTATYGDAGQTADNIKWPQSMLGEIRKNEFEKAMQVLGVKEHEWLGYKDGQLPNVDTQQAVNQIVELINKIKPDTIFSFGPDGLSGHNDHRTVYSWTLEAIKKSGSQATFYTAVESRERYETIGKKCDDAFDIYFNIDQPVTILKADIDLLFIPNKDECQKKTESLRVQECQTAQIFADPLGQELIKSVCDHEGFMKVSV